MLSLEREPRPEDRERRMKLHAKRDHLAVFEGTRVRRRRRSEQSDTAAMRSERDEIAMDAQDVRRMLAAQPPEAVLVVAAERRR